ncbi:MAG: ribulose 1,5-bisphosphate carboxylase large subunit [Rhodococcus sp. (in: high G+C Gram-positive bacteria)]
MRQTARMASDSKLPVRTVRLPVPSVGDLIGVTQRTILWSLDTVAFVSQLPKRIDDLFVRIDEIMSAIEDVTDRAGGVIDKAAATTDDAGVVIVGAGDASSKALAMISELEPITERAIPLGRSFVENFSDEELRAAIKMVDHLPELLDRMDGIMPILATLDTVSPEIHELLEVTKDVRKAVVGIPGFKFFRKRGEDELSD